MSDTKLLLFRLPNSLFVRFLSECLGVHDVGKLDLAMTNKKHRPEFLQCLKEMRNSTVPDSFDGRSEHDTNMLKWISVRQIYLETLSLILFTYKEFMESLHIPSLRKLKVGSHSEWLRHIPQLSPYLEDLSVGRFNDGATVKNLIFVLSQCLHLTTVSIDSLLFQHSDCTDDVLAEFQEFGHLIVEIRNAYGYLRKVTTKGFRNFLKECPGLRKLGYSSFEDNGELLKCVAQSSPLLEDLTLDTCSKSALLELSRNCKQLRKVAFWRFDVKLTDLPASSVKVLEEIETLEELDLRSCGLTNEKLAVISGFRHLKRLHLEEDYGIDGLTGADFRVLKGSPISETLQSISVSFEDGGDHDLPLQDFDIAGMVAGFASCHNLRKADLSYHCDDAGLVVLGAGCPLLEEISLTYGPVTVEGLVDLAEHCQHLTKVVLDYDRNEGRDLEAEGFRNSYFDGSKYGPGHARAVEDIEIVRSRLPHIQIECFEDFDLD